MLVRICTIGVAILRRDRYAASQGPSKTLRIPKPSLRNTPSNSVRVGLGFRLSFTTVDPSSPQSSIVWTHPSPLLMDFWRMKPDSWFSNTHNPAQAAATQAGETECLRLHLPRGCQLSTRLIGVVKGLSPCRPLYP